ncbi:MAG: HPr family phosphocarrier protein [Spirochaetota bacterium]
MTERDITIKNRAGIHARPAALIVQTAGRYDSDIYFRKDSEEISAKSIMGIITLGAGYNSVLKVVADGPDEEEAVDAVASLFESRFEEE